MPGSKAERRAGCPRGPSDDEPRPHRQCERPAGRHRPPARARCPRLLGFPGPGPRLQLRPGQGPFGSRPGGRVHPASPGRRAAPGRSGRRRARRALRRGHRPVGSWNLLGLARRTLRPVLEEAPLLFSTLLVFASASILTPEQAVAAALANAPALAERLADLDQAAGVHRQEGGLLRHNPVLDVSASTDGAQVVSSVVQPISITGEGSRASRSARARVDSARAAAHRGRYETAADTRRAYARAVQARELLRFADEDRALLARLRGVAEARVAVGEGVNRDLRLARLEEARAMAAWLEAQTEVAASDAELAALIGRTPGELVRDPLAAFPVPSSDSSPRSDVLATQAATRSAREALDRERAAALPPVGIGAYFEKDDDVNTVGFSLSFELPLWNRNQSAIGAALGDLRLARAVETWTSARARTEEAQATGRLKVAEEALATLVPDIQAEAAPALKAIEELFVSGESNLPDTLLLRSRVVEGERAWMTARTQVAEARIDAALARQSKSLLP